MNWTLIVTFAGLSMVVVGVLGICQAARMHLDDDDALRDAGYTAEDIARMHREWARSTGRHSRITTTPALSATAETNPDIHA